MLFFKNHFLRKMIAISIIVICGQVFLNIFFIYPAFVKRATESAESEAARIATYLIPYVKQMVRFPGISQNSDELTLEMEHFFQNFNLFKINVFDPSGKKVYSTMTEETDQNNESEYFRRVLDSGQSVSTTIKKVTRDIENQMVTAQVVETFVPMIEKNRIVGVLEIYYDITELHRQLIRLFWISTSLLLSFSILLFLIVLYLGKRMVQLQNRVIEKEKFQAILEMAGMVCHEINQPLMIISGYVEILLDNDNTDNSVLSKIKIIDDQTKRIDEITTKLMEITSYESREYLKGSIIDLEKASKVKK